MILLKLVCYLSNSSQNNKSIYIKKFIGPHIYGNDLLPLMCQLKFVPLTNWERGQIILPRSFMELTEFRNIDQKF